MNRQLYENAEDVKIDAGSQVLCDEHGYGVGTVIKLLPLETTGDDIEKLMLVQFPEREHSTMCDFKSMITVHDDKKRKLWRVK